MQQSLNPPAPFLSSPGLPLVEWEQWKEGFEAYLEAIEGEVFTQKKKYAILRHSLGTEGRKVLKHLPPSPVVGEGDAIDEYASAIKVLDLRFKKKKNVIMERHKFYKRQQLPGETVENFISDLRVLAATCDFKTFEDEIIRDQLVEKSNSQKIQEKLLTIHDLTLDKAVEVASNIESTTKFMEQMNIKTQVHAVQNPDSSKSKKMFSKADDKKKTFECYRCGSKYHLGNSPSCPALDKWCGKCRRKGHFMKVCRAKFSKNQNTFKSVNVVEGAAKPHDPDSDDDSIICVFNDAASHESAINKDVISVSEVTIKKPHCLIVVNGLPIKMMADSGS